MKILGYEYEVVGDGNADHMGAFGRMHAKTQTLEIAEDLHDEQIVSSILHEAIEALNYHLSLNLPHETIMSLEASLYQVLSDNGVDLSPLKELIKMV